MLPWLVLVVGVLSLWPFARFELGLEEPLIDVRLMASPAQWPVQLTAFLFGMSVLGAQIPLSTFARTDPDEAGYGLGASAGFVSTLIGVYVLALVAGALLLPVVGRVDRHPWRDARRAASWSRSATACSCRCTTRRPRPWRTWRSPASAPARSWRRSPRRQPPRRRRTARASSPA